MKNSKIKIAFNKLEFQEFKELINLKSSLNKNSSDFEKFDLDFNVFYNN